MKKHLLKSIRKAVCCTLAIISCILTAVPAFAISNKSMESESKPLAVSVRSPEFPNAYIIINDTSAVPQSVHSNNEAGQVVTVSATVFVEEEYDYQNGKQIVLNSRLLSKQEVEAIGEDNFEPLSDRSARSETATNSRGRLTINASGTYNKSGNSVTVDLTGNGSWTYSNLATSDTRPAPGDDFVGWTWGGGHTATSSYCGIHWNAMLGDQQVPTAKSAPNAGRVWAFQEYKADAQMTLYVEDFDCDISLKKNVLEGNGNTTEAVMQYVHTYQENTGSINFGISSSPGVSGGFSISSTSKQWEIAVTITNIPY